MRATCIRLQHASGFCLLAVFLLAAALPAGRTAEAQFLGAGDAARSLALRDIRGEMVRLVWKGPASRVTMLEVFSTGCHACLEAVSRCNAIARQYPAVDMTGICLGTQPADVAAFAADRGASYRVLADPDMLTYYLYGVPKVPQFFLIDRRGRIQYRCGAAGLDILQERLSRLLQEGTAMPDGSDTPLYLTDGSGLPQKVVPSEQGRRTVLGFLAGNAPDIAEAAGVLAGLSGKPYGEPVRVIGIVPRDRAAAAGDIPPGFPLLVDENGAAFERYGAGSVPLLVQVDERGRLRRQTVIAMDDSGPGGELRAAAETEGALPPDELRAAVDRQVPHIRLWEPVSVDGQRIYCAVINSGERLYVREVRAALQCDVCSDVYFYYALDQQGLYRLAGLLRPLDYFGAPIAAERFLQQFVGRSYHETFHAGGNVDSISGATKSCQAIISEFNQTESIFREYTADPAFDAAFREKICFMQQAFMEWAVVLQRRAASAADPSPSVQDIEPYCPGGRLPRCPSGGSYRILLLNNIPRVLCTHHGIDPQTSGGALR